VAIQLKTEEQRTAILLSDVIGRWTDGASPASNVYNQYWYSLQSCLRLTVSQVVQTHWQCCRPVPFAVHTVYNAP